MRQNIPNALTLFRILLVPIVCGLLMLTTLSSQSWLPWLAAILFVAAALTDFLDGYLARKWQVISNFGRMLDPIADKLLVLAMLFTLACVGSLGKIEMIAGVVIVMREVAVTGLREFLAAKNTSVPVSWTGKTKAAVQMIALVALILAPALGGAIPLIASALIVLAAILTFWSGWEYFAQGLKEL